MADMPHTLITADVHLQPDDTDPINQAFYRFLDQDAPKADALYIIGDLFEMWVGDDHGLEHYATVIRKFKHLTEHGLPIYLMYGNRDFPMRRAFFDATGIQFLKEPALVNLYGLPILMLHGDSLCTDDKAFQRMRILLRNRLVTWLFLKLPEHKRVAIGENMRANSQKYNLNKAENIMDVNEAAVRKLLQRHPQCRHLVHGHTHRPYLHQIEQDDQIKHRWVLGDWRPETEVLKVWSNQTLELVAR